MASINATINKVKRALSAQGRMPLIDNRQFYGDDGQPITKYIVHYGRASGKNNDVIGTAFNKVDLLKILIEVLKGGAGDG